MNNTKFHGVNVRDILYLGDFLPKEKLHEGVQVIFECGYQGKHLQLIMADSKKDAAYKINVLDMANSEEFIALLDDKDKALVLRLSKITDKEHDYLGTEECAHDFNSLMSMNWDKATSEYAKNISNWKPKKRQDHFTVWAEVQRDKEKMNYQLEVLPSPHHALAYLNNNYRSVDGEMYIIYGKSF